MDNEQTYKEQTLFRLISTGDETAFEELFHLYVPRIEPLIGKLVKTETAVKDIIQEVFLQLWIGREKLPEIESPANWIFKIVYNRSFSWLKKRKIRERSLMHAATGKEGGSHYETEEILAFEETSRLLKQAVRELPPQSKKIYLMRESGLKREEIAARLGLSPNTVRNSLARSSEMIRSFLSSHGIEIPIVLIIWFF